MQVRQVRSAHPDGGELQIELHPAVTVLTGLGDDGRETVGDLLAAVIYGEVADLAGSVDVEGRTIGLDEWAGLVDQRLGEFDVFVRAGDLPGADGRREWTEQLQRAREDARLADAALAAAQLDLAARREALVAAEAAASERAREAEQAAEAAANASATQAADAVARAAEAEQAERDAKAAATDAGRRRTAMHRARTAAEKQLAHVAAGRQGLADELGAAEAVVGAADVAAVEAQRLTDVAHAAEENALAASRTAEQSERRQAERKRVTAELEAARADAERRVQVARQASEAANARAAEAQTALAAATRALDAARKREREAGAAKARARARADLDAKRAGVARLEQRLAAALAEDQAEAGLDVGGASTPGGPAAAGPGGRGRGRGRSGPVAKGDVAPGAAKNGDAGPRGAPEVGAADGPGGAGVGDASGADGDAGEQIRAAEAVLADRRAEVDRRRRRVDEVAQARASLTARRSELRARLDAGTAGAGSAAPGGDTGAAGAGDPVGGVPRGEVERITKQAEELRALAAPAVIARAGELVEAFDAAIAERQGVNTGAPRWLVESARAELEAARAAVDEARTRIEQNTFTPADAADLEVAHAVVVDAEAATGRRIGGAAARRRLEAAQATEAQILDRMGFASYSAYLLRTVATDAAPVARTRLHEAERALADAELVWAEVQQADLAGERAELDASEPDLLAAAAAVLGAQPCGLEEGRAALDDVARQETRRHVLAAALEAVVGSAAKPADGRATGRPESRAAGRGDGRAAPADDTAALLAAVDAWVEAAGETTERSRAGDADRAAAERQLAEVEADLAGLAGDEVERDAAEAEAAAADAEQDIVMLRSRLAAEAVRQRVTVIEEELRAARAELEQTAAAARAPATGDTAPGELAEQERQVAARKDQAEEARATARSRAAELRAIDAEFTAATRALQQAAKPGRSARGASRLPDPDAARADAGRLTALAEAARAEATDAIRRAGEADAAAKQARAARQRLATRLSAAEESETQLREAVRAAEVALADADAERAGAEGDLADARAAVAAARAASRATAEADGGPEHRVAPPAQAHANGTSAAMAEEVEAALAEETAAVQALYLADANASEAAQALVRAERLAMQPREPAAPVAAEDAEIYLLARMAGARAVGGLGSLPLLLVDPLVDVPAEGMAPILNLLVRMSPAVQVLFLTDDPAVVDWAERLGRIQASVVRFGPALATA